MLNYGIYAKWDQESKDVPQIVKITTEIPARPGLEFGYILQIKKGKNKKIQFCIDHPPFLNSKGEPAPPFVGEEFIRTNDFQFFLGDSVWQPVADKIGIWRLTCEIDNQNVADKSFEIFATA